MTDQLLFRGFDRVIVNYEGEGWAELRAASAGIKAVVGFRRNDGWTLGSPSRFEKVAYRMWLDEWTHFIREGHTQWQPISEYK